MVNTFLLSASFSKSAKLLHKDSKRGPNQRREAYQVLCALEYFHIIAELFDWERCPYTSIEHMKNNDPHFIATSFLERAKWAIQLRKRYVNQKLRIVIYGITENCISEKRYKIVHVDRMHKYFTPYELKNNVVKEKYKITHKIYKLGFSTHAISKMWIGYENTLRYYLNCHIQASIDFGINNNMRFHTVDHKNLVYPWWVPLVIPSHKASLLRKNYDVFSQCITFSDVGEYIEFNDRWRLHGYVWTASMTHRQIVDYLNGVELQAEEVCAPVLNK
jgi:hypothetical protein